MSHEHSPLSPPSPPQIGERPLSLPSPPPPVVSLSLYLFSPFLSCAVAEFFSQFYANSDLEAFSRLTGERSTPIDEHRDVEGDLHNDQHAPGEEAQLDVEYLLALAPNSSARFYSMADRNPCDREPRAARAARRREASARL